MVAAAAVAGPLAAGCGGGEGSSGGTNNQSVPATISNAVVTVPFDLEGGGSATVGETAVTLPATRIAVDVSIEGMVVPMFVDTGSSTMVLEPALYDAIVADGRPQSTTSVATIMGTENVPSTKLRDVSL